MHFLNQRLHMLIINVNDSSSNQVTIEGDIISLGIKCMENCIRVLARCVNDTSFAERLCNDAIKIDAKYSIAINDNNNCNINVKKNGYALQLQLDSRSIETNGFKEMVDAIQLNCIYKNVKETNMITAGGLATIAKIVGLSHNVDIYLKPIISGSCNYTYNCDIMPLIVDFIRQYSADRDKSESNTKNGIKDIKTWHV